jgi:protein-L-isoaspartate(D-aspartate) O-methyltransferase
MRLLLLVWTAAMLTSGCPSGCEEESPAGPRSARGSGGEDQATEGERGDRFTRARKRMVRTQMRDVADTDVLQAMRQVPRHRFVPEDLRDQAYRDHPLPIGHDQTISQPYIVAKMTELAEVDEGDTVLEVGTGSGYQAAVLAELGAEVYTIEIVEPLARSAKQLLSKLGYANVHVRHGDGYAGWPERAPFDAVVVTAAPPDIPAPLKEQLAVGGKLVVPVGEVSQELLVLERTEQGFKRHSAFPVRFVPMTGKAQREDHAPAP